MSERGTEAGFSLVEVAVALVVFALGAMTLLEVQTASLRTASELEDRALAAIVAENRMAERLAGPPRAAGTLSGEEEIAGRDMRWRERSIATADPAILRIEIDVRREDGGQVLATLTGFAGTP